MSQQGQEVQQDQEFQKGQEVPAKPRSPSQVKKSQPGQEVPARPRSPIQAKKSQPGQEVPARPRCPIQAKKSQPGQEIPTRPRNSVRPKIPVRSRSPARSRCPWKVNKSCKVNIRKLQQLYHTPPELFLVNTQSISAVIYFPAISILILHVNNQRCLPVKRRKIHTYLTIFIANVPAKENLQSGSSFSSLRCCSHPNC